jgi:DNA-directed RNA polymerase subunit H (RpoH/RPB5)
VRSKLACDELNVGALHRSEKMQHPIFVIYKNLPAFIEARKLKTDYQFKYDEKSLDSVIDNMEKTGFIDIKLTGERREQFESKTKHSVHKHDMYKQEQNLKNPKDLKDQNPTDSKESEGRKPSSEVSPAKRANELNEVGEVREKTGVVRIIILYANSEYSRKTPKLRSLISSIESSEDYVAGRVMEVIYIVDNDFVEKKSSLVAAIEERRGTEENKNVYIRLCTYRMFIINILLKPEVPKSKIMTKEEVDEHLSHNMKNPKDLNTISEKNDAIVTWLGARKGDYIQHEILSRNCGITYKVRRVI